MSSATYKVTISNRIFNAYAVHLVDVLPRFSSTCKLIYCSRLLRATIVYLLADVCSVRNVQRGNRRNRIMVVACARF